jgi:acetyl-CoA carboxylase carboxyltransferase component
MARRRRTKQKDRLGIAMLLGALVGFAIGAVIGLGSTALDAPVLLPFAGAAVGVLVAAVIVGVMSVGSAREQAARRASERARAHARLRHAAHDGWIDDIDLTAETRPPPRSARR